MNEHTPESTVSLALPVAAKPVIERIRQLISIGRGVEALPCLARLDEFVGDNPTFLNWIKGTLLIDIADDLRDLDCARRGVSLIKDLDVATFPESARSAYWYNLGNGHGTIYHIQKTPSGVRRVLNEDFGRAKQCYRKAMTLG